MGKLLRRLGSGLGRLRGRRRRRAHATGSEGTAAGLREALCRVLEGDLEGAEVALSELARVDSSATDVYLALANVYRARGEVGRAIQIHQNLRVRSDLSSELRREALLGLAFDFRAGGFLGRAASSLEEFLREEPRHDAALRELESLHVERGEWKEALALRRVIGSGDPDTPRIRAHLWAGLARAQIESGSLSDAQRSLRRALASDRSCAQVYLVFGELRLRERKHRKAIDLLVRALPLHPRVGMRVYPCLWEAYEHEGDLEGFAGALAERVQQDPEDLEAQLWLGRSLISVDRAEDGLARLRRLLDQAPDYHPAYTEIGRALLERGRGEEAVKHAEELLSRIPSLAPALRCARCSTPHAVFRFRCPQCGAWDTLS